MGCTVAKVSWIGRTLLASVAVAVAIGFGATATAQAPARASDKDAYVAAFLRDRAANPAPVQRLLDIRSIAQQCGNFCGPATLYSAVTYSGASTTQAQMALAAGTPGCGINAAGTCVSAIRNVLNARYLNPPAPSWFQMSPPPDAERYWGMVGVDVYERGVPLGNLINPNPADGSPYCMPTWCNTTASSVHFVLTTGVAGAYDGSDRSASVYFVDSATGQHLGDAVGVNGWWMSVNSMTSIIAFNDGYGGCEGASSVVW